MPSITKLRTACVALSVLAVLVGACGSAASPSPAGSAAPPSPADSAAPPSPAASAASEDFSGITVNLVTFTVEAEPLQRHATEWEKLTGGKVNVITFPFSDLYNKILTDVSTDTKAFTLITMAASWMGDLAGPGYLEDLSSAVTSSAGLRWDDVTPFYRGVNASYNGKTVGVPIDGDVLTLYYRSDLLAKDGLQPPETWDDYLAIAKQYNGQDLNGDGAADYGSCLSKARSGVGTWIFNAILSSYTQTKGTGQGAFFGDNMEPLVNNEAMAAALDVWKATSDYGPPGENTIDQGTGRGLFLSGRCALTWEWGDVGTSSIDPKTSSVNGKVGTAMLPGTKNVLDRATGKLVPCDASTCPNAINGVNRAPFAAFGGWIGVINQALDQRAKDAAFSFLAYVASPEVSLSDVTNGATGMNPYRTSHTASIDPWVAAGFTTEGATTYLKAISDSQASPNMVLDLRIPQANEYTNVVEDTALAGFLAGELTADQAMKQMYDGWQQITDKQGRQKQADTYAATLLTP